VSATPEGNEPYQQRVIADVERSMSLVQSIGVPAKTFNLHWGRKAGLFDPWRMAR